MTNQKGAPLAIYSRGDGKAEMTRQGDNGVTFNLLNLPKPYILAVSKSIVNPYRMIRQAYSETAP